MDTFRGNGWDGIDAHWRSKHEHLMPYQEAWPLISAGAYSPIPTPQASIELFSGCFAAEGERKLTIEEIKEITERAWAGDR